MLPSTETVSPMNKSRKNINVKNVKNIVNKAHMYLNTVYLIFDLIINKF